MLKNVIFILTALASFCCTSGVPKIPKNSASYVILRENSRKFECKVSDINIIENITDLRNRFSFGWRSTWHTLPAAEKEFLFYDSKNDLLGQFGFLAGTAVIYDGWLLRSLDKKEETLLRNEFEKSRRTCK